MYISEDRLIILDCAPFLSNPLVKESILNELDELKILILLYNICHTVIAVENLVLNPNFIRLLVCAEMMKSTVKDIAEDYTAKLVFVQNKTDVEDLQIVKLKKKEKIYKTTMKGTNFEDPNFIAVPNFDELNSTKICDQDKAYRCIANFRHQILMGKSKNFVTASQVCLNEKMWLQMVAKAWEMNSSNFFLKKYLTLREKFNLLNHVQINENSKDRNIYYPDE